jgi:hypothetical protein
MASLADHAAPTAVHRRARFTALYPDEIEYLNRPATQDTDQPGCIYCKCSFSERCAGWFVGACRNCCCKEYDPF